MAPAPWFWQALGSIQSAFHSMTDPYRLAKAQRSAAPLTKLPLVSVIVPTFDRVAIVREITIPALLEQTYTNFHVLIVGDGCPKDISCQLAELESERIAFLNLRWRTTYPRNPVQRWMVAGARPRNVGARSIAGEVVLWMSDDDVLKPTAIEELVHTLIQKGVDIALGTCTTTLTPAEESMGIIRRPPSGKVWLARRHTTVLKWNRLSWAKHWNRPSDYDLFARLLAAGAHFAYSPQPVVSLIPVGNTGLHGSKAWELHYRTGTGL